MKVKLLVPTLFVMLLFASTALPAQCDYCIGGKSLVELRQEMPITQSLIPTQSVYRLWPILASSSIAEKQPLPAMMEIRKLPKSWCYDELAFFCRMEVKLENATKFPVKFRLGDVQYVDRLEGKY